MSIIGSIATSISYLMSIITISIALHNLWLYFYKKRCLIKLFGFNKNKTVFCTLGIFKEEYNKKHDKKLRLLEFEYIKIYERLVLLCRKLGYDLKIGNDRMDDQSYNAFSPSIELHFGGPLPNANVYHILSDYFKDKIIYYCKYSKSETPINNLDDNGCVKYNENERYFKICETKLSIDETTDYIFLIKKILPEPNHKIIHVLFSVHNAGTKKVIDLLENYSKELYKIVGKDQYFLIVPINVDTDRIQMDKIINVTDKMF